MTADDQTASLAADLANRSDDELAELLSARPDLASPPPAGTAVLARRALSAGSVNLVGDDLDLLAVAVVETMLELSALADSSDGLVRSRSVIEALAGRADQDDIAARINWLRARAVVWGPDDAVRCGAHAATALPWRGRHTLGPLSAMSLADIRERIDGLDGTQRDVVHTLASGSPLGRTRDAVADADPKRPVPSLISAGVLARVDEQTVELVPVVGQIIRGEPAAEPAELREPVVAVSSGRSRFGAADVDAAAGGEALELLRHASLVIDALGARPAAVLRSGGLGVREIRRLAKDTGVDAGTVALIVEILGGDRLIDTGYPDPFPLQGSDEIYWTPTTSVDSWRHKGQAERWFGLARAWLDLPRRPWQIGEKNREGTILAALSGDLYDASTVTERRMILSALDSAPPGRSAETESLVIALGWRHPRWQRRLTKRVVSETLSEARQLGLVAHSALTSPGRGLLSGRGDEATEVALTAMSSALPEPIDYFLTQADLTVTAPGPLAAGLADELSLVADIESAGAASVYRVTEESVRRALDAGRSTSELIALFTNHSRSPVPQSLEYLIADVGRKHGQLRVGFAGAFIRCEDPTMLAAVLNSSAAEELSLRALAPTVAVSAAGVREVLDVLRSAGFAPAGEDSSGAVVDLAVRGSRVPVTRSARTPTPRRPSAPTADQLVSIVGRIRAHDAADSAAPSASSGSVRTGGAGQSVTALLQLALRMGRRVLVDYVDAHGAASRHVAVPRALGGGQLTAADPQTGEQLRFPVHRIRAIELLDS